ncbi:MAG: prolipoprotein diacylglyceryl transferase [Natronospirillum sp.]|uniref:prolipoprotein diacylglyceryl transferase n=1 Tax=Natronospirillum sp. TaxID=2812955 RepID=UPI0025E33A84|nr:prolipoprotein diacylglyceryl transferase [Natronospirillum sp.]MCH8550453.1 prolipoprotein diacylglyceryl transferase [Natronospirillum sp.]
MPYVHDINPVALDLGFLQVHWYGVSYLVTFFVGLALGLWRARNQPWRGWTKEQVWDMLTYVIIGTLIGGRMGYVFFYQFGEFLDNPLYLFNFFAGGMSFHGGFIGVSVALILYARRTGKSYWQVADFIAPLAPIGFAAVRTGNFINGELWGRATDVPWAMIFPHAPDDLARHPSQLYQAAGEGLALFILLWWFSHKPRPRFAVTGFFLAGYAIFRSIAEFFREPDAHIGYLAGEWLTMGILLSLPMLILGIIFLVMAYRLQIDDRVDPAAVAAESTDSKPAGLGGQKNKAKSKSKSSKKRRR